MLAPEILKQWVVEGHARAVELIDDLSDEQMHVSWIPTINPVLWEFCHASFFYEFFLIRQGAGLEPVSPTAASLFDSMNIGHETRWRLPIPDRKGALEYVNAVHSEVLALIEGGLDEKLSYLVAYSVFHGDMHTEAVTYTRQALGYAAPTFDLARTEVPAVESVTGDVEFAGGTYRLGAMPDAPFCFDNEKWAHDVEVQPFSMSRTAVTEGQFQEFVLAGGYECEEFWCPQGWGWRHAMDADLPIHWRKAAASQFERRHFDAWIPIEDNKAMCQVNWYEAMAWCRWAKRRLPTEAEWELAASANASQAIGKRVLPWGDSAASIERCNLDWTAMGPVDVSAFAAGDSASGLRQMIGNVWEWTSSTFAPYPDFTPDMYSDYSQVSFHTRKVLRGGCWATRTRTIRNSWRNFFQPARRDIYAGLRTCRL